MEGTPFGTMIRFCIFLKRKGNRQRLLYPETIYIVDGKWLHH
uniref:Uncharacterized protein n=1 Tax=Faecalibaculum rodentium TaxID=1702221 RepID=A0A140DWH5_9FIRM|nr:hypothetical protein AALO17_18680 [Faecalibaculum rodentium]